MERHGWTTGVGERPALPRVRVSAFLTRANQVLLVRQRRPAERDDAGYWLLPGGGVRFGESLADALVRELREELSMQAHPERPIALAESISPDTDYPKHVLHVVYLAHTSGSQPSAPRATDPAVLEARYFVAAELPRISMRPPFADVLARFLHGPPEDMEYLGRLW